MAENPVNVEKNKQEVKDAKESSETIQSEDVLTKLAAAFSKMDVNQDGTISKQEFIQGVLQDKEIQAILHIPIEFVGEKSPTAEPAQGKHGERRGSLKMRDKDLKRRATRTRNLGIALKYFKKLDMDNSGAIDVNEFSTFFQSKDLEDLIENAIEKEDNIVTENLSKEDANMLRQFFNFLDSDQSGLVSYIELCEGLGPQLANEMFSTMDEDGNKYLGFDEIIKALDLKFKGVKESERVNKLGELAQKCLASTRRSKQTAIRTRRPADMLERKARSSSPLKHRQTKQLKPIETGPSVAAATDLLKKYAEKTGGSTDFGTKR